jgi:hypothetical protein
MLFLRRCVAQSSLGLALLLPAPTLAAPSEQTSSTTKTDAARAPQTSSVGVDLAYVQPLGAYANASGPPLGALLRVAHRSVPGLEVGLRSGFLFALTHTSRRVDGELRRSQLSLFPLWASVRYFIFEADRGLYVATEVGLNVLVPHGGELGARFGTNAGIGAVTSGSVPVDLRVQAMVLNLFEDMPRDVGSERTYVGLGISLGYTFDR